MVSLIGSLKADLAASKARPRGLTSAWPSPLFGGLSDAVQPPRAAEPPRPANAVGLLILAAWLALGLLLARTAAAPGVLTFAFVLTGWVLSVMAHEFAHAGVAWLAGDHTVAEKGYLSFDPSRYGDLGVSLVIPLLAVALGGVALPGGAVYLRHDLMRGPVWRAAASLAGPAATLLALLALVVAARAWTAAGPASALLPALSVLAFLQTMALLLNLLPVPGLDGFNALKPFLPARLAPALRKAEGLTIGLIFLAIFVVPGFGATLFRAAAALAVALGLEPTAIAEGWRAFHFWR